MAIDTRDKEYICPGERHPISRSIHLARQAAFFPPCRQCPLREDERLIALRTTVAPASEISEAGPPPVRFDEGRGHVTSSGDLFTSEGVRGVFLNQLTRGRAETRAAAFAIWLWETGPVSGHNDGIDRGARQVRPTVVAGYDERPSSPAVLSSVIAGLRRMGCHVIDVGLATKPCLWFAVDHLHASGGVFVTGAGCEPSFAGIDFVGASARPISLPGGLSRVRELAGRPLSRPTRDAGTERTFQPADPYEESVRRQFQNLRSLTVACASPSVLVRETVERVFAPLECQLLAVDLPMRVRNPAHRRDADMLRLSTAVRESLADLGILIDDDGLRCGFVDERGRHVSPGAIARFVVPPMLAKSTEGNVLLEPGAFNEMRPLIEGLGGLCQHCPDTFEAAAAAMADNAAVYAGGDTGRHWFRESVPTCDALHILARVLVASSRANVPFSELAAG
jgi:phosphomannomutase